MTEPDPDPLAGVYKVTADILGQAHAMRSFSAPGIDAIPHQVHSALVHARARLDQLEVLLGRAMDLRHGAEMEARRREQAEQDAWDGKADTARRKGMRAEYEGAQERYATWRLQVRTEVLAARHAREVADISAACEAKVRLAYRGLDNARQDLHQRLRALAFESAMERT